MCKASSSPLTSLYHSACVDYLLYWKRRYNNSSPIISSLPDLYNSFVILAEAQKWSVRRTIVSGCLSASRCHWTGPPFLLNQFRCSAPPAADLALDFPLSAPQHRTCLDTRRLWRLFYLTVRNRNCTDEEPKTKIHISKGINLLKMVTNKTCSPGD